MRRIAFWFTALSVIAIVAVSCTDRYVRQPLEFLLNATPARFYMFSGFVVAQKNKS